jgi:hypothetical protein
MAHGSRIAPQYAQIMARASMALEILHRALMLLGGLG